MGLVISTVWLLSSKLLWMRLVIGQGHTWNSWLIGRGEQLYNNMAASMGTMWLGPEKGHLAEGGDWASNIRS